MNDSDLAIAGLGFVFFLGWIFVALLLAILTGFIAGSKNRSGIAWFLGTLLIGVVFSPLFGFFMMLAVGMSGAKEKAAPKPRKSLAELASSNLAKGFKDGYDGKPFRPSSLNDDPIELTRDMEVDPPYHVAGTRRNPHNWKL